MIEKDSDSSLLPEEFQRRLADTKAQGKRVWLVGLDDQFHDEHRLLEQEKETERLIWELSKAWWLVDDLSIKWEQEIKRGQLRRFPILGGGSIPWSVAEDAYVAYAARYGNSQSLERLAERGGFSKQELDELTPNWREATKLNMLLHQAMKALDVILSHRYDWSGEKCAALARDELKAIQSQIDGALNSLLRNKQNE